LSIALATAELRRLQAGWAVSAVGGWIFFVVLAVYAYSVGGATAVGAAALIRMVPAGLAAPLAGVLADRHPRRDVLLGTLVARAVLLTAIAGAVALTAPIAAVLALAALFTIAQSAHKPAQAALLTALARTPAQLAASNALWNASDNVAFLLGALLAGTLIASAGVSTAFIVIGALFAIAALPIARIDRDPVPDYRAAAGRAHPLGDAIEGFREVARRPGLRLIVAVLTASTLVEGAADVLVVVVAIHLLDLGGAGVGWLNACWGVGGVLGSAATITLLGRGRLTAGVASGGLLVGIPLIVVGVTPEAAIAPAMLILLGIGYALIEIAGTSLLQRLASADVIGRAFAVVESSYWITTGLGAMLAPAAIQLLGARGAVILFGASLPLLVAIRWRALAALEAGVVVPERPFLALRAVSMFAPLPLATLEHVSCQLDELRVPAGETVIREGEYGDCVYVVADGVLDVCCELGAFPPISAGDHGNSRLMSSRVEMRGEPVGAKRAT
jgi:predicted MFS family arabinose efflux permease